MARTPDHLLGDALVNPEAAEQVREVFDRPEMPPPPVEDHPMTAFARDLLAPMFQNFQPYETPILGGVLRGADIAQRATIDAGSGLVGIGLQKAAEAAGGGRGREEQAVTSAVGSQLGSLPEWARPFAAPYLYAAGASEAKRIAQKQADIPRVKVGPVDFDLLDAAELALPGTGLIGAARKAPNFVQTLTHGIPTPKGAIATHIDEAVNAGATPEQAFASAQQRFGTYATGNFAEKGHDIFVQSAEPAARAAADATVAAGRETADQIDGGAQRFADTQQRLADQTAQATSDIESKGFRPTEVGPTTGSGKPRENLGENIDKIDTNPATKDYIEEVAKTNDGFEAQRRGVVTTAETQAAAAKIEVDAQKYAYLQPGTALNAEQLVAVRGAMIAKGEEVTKLQEIIALERGAGSVSKENQLRLLAAAAEHQTLQRAFAGARAESGRALRIQREVGTALQQGNVAGAYDRAAALLGGQQNVSGLMDRLQRIWTDPALTAIERDAATYRFVQNLDEAKFFDKIDEYWINAVLSSPVTHTVNVTGQTALQLAEIASKTVSAAVEAVTTLGGKLRPRERFFSEALVSPFGAVAGLGDGFRRAGLMLKHGIDPGDIQKFKEGGRVRAGQALEGTAGNILNIPTRILGAEDKVFYGVGYSRGLYESAARIAAREKKSLVALNPTQSDFAKRVGELLQKPTDEMRTYADVVGRRAGLRSEPGKFTKKIIDIRDTGKEIGGLGEFRPLRYVVPFINTPMQLVKIGAEYSPLGFAKVITAKGGERSDAIARAVMGSTAMGFFAQQYGLGSITGAAPTDIAERDAFYASGKIPYAVKLGDKWVEFGRLEPVATPLKWTALAMDAAKKDPNQPFDVLATKMGFSVAKSMEDSTYFAAIGDLVDALADPSKADRFLSRIATGFIPAAERAAVQTQDSYLREPKGIVQQIEAVLPIVNENVPIRQTVYGQPVERTEGKQGIAGLVSPVNFQTERTDPITQKLATYKLPENLDANGNPLPARGLLVGKVSASVASFQLNTEEANRFQRYAGQAHYNLLDKLFTDKLPYDGKSFSKLAYEDQVRAIRKAGSDAHDVGAAQLADELEAKATNSGQVSRAAQMRLTTLSTIKDKAYYLEGLKTKGKLDGSVAAYIDSRRGKGDPTTAEYVRAAPLVRQYIATPPFTIGNPTEWEALKVAKKAASDYAKKNPPPPGMSEWQWLYRVDPKSAELVRKYTYAWVPNAKRTELRRRYPFIERFVS